MRHERSAGVIGQTLLRAILVIVVGVVGIVVLAILLLQFDAVTTRVLPLASGLLPWDNARLEVDHAALSGVNRLRTTNLRIVVPGERPLLAIDSLDLSIRPLALLRGRVDIPELRVAGVRAVTRQQPDSSWTLLEPFRPPVDSAPPAEPLRIRIGAMDVSDVAIIGLYAGTSDSLLIEDVVIRLTDLRVDGSIAVELDTVHARVLARGRARPAVVSGRARLSEGQLTVAGFRLRSDSSDVAARGTLVLPGGSSGEIHDVDFRLAAEPLDFRDVAPLLPEFLKPPASIRLTAHVTGRSSLVAVNLDGRTSDGAVLHLEGRLTPRTTGPVRYALNGQLRHLDPRRVGFTGSRGRTGAEFEVDLAGDSLRAVNGTASFRLASVQLDGMELKPSRVTARVEQGVAHYRTDGALEPWASWSGSGTLDVTGDLPSYTLALRVDQLEAIPDSGSLQVRGIVANLRANGSGFRAAEREGRASMQVERGQVGHAAIAQGRADAQWRQDRARADLVARLEGESPVLDSLGARLDWEAGKADVRLQFRGVDLAAAGPGWPASHLNGAGRLRFEPGPVESMQARGAVDLDSSSSGAVALGPGHVEVELARGRLSLRGNLHALEGDIRLVASGRPFDPVPQFVLERIRFEDVVLGRLTGGRVRDPLSGVLVARGTLPPDAPPQVTGRLDLEGAPFRRGRLDTLHAEFAVSGRRVEVDAMARTGQGNLALAGEAELARDAAASNGSASWSLGHATLDGRFDLPDLGALVADSGEGQASGRIHLAGQGTDVETMRWDSQAEFSGRWQAARLDTLRLEGRIADARLTIDTLVVRSNLLHGGGGGQTALGDSDAGPADTIRIRLVADTSAPATLSGLFGIDPLSTRMGAIDIRAWHAEQKLQVTGRASLGGLIAGTGGADSLDITAGAAVGPSGIAEINGTITALRVAWNRVELQRLDATLESEPGRFAFTATAARDNGHTLEVAGNGVRGERKLFFTGFGFGFGETRWALVDTASVTWGNRLVISDFELRTGARRISIAGVLDRAAAQDLTIQLDSVPLGPFAEFADFAGLDATLDGTVRVDGPAASPGLHTDLSLRMPAVTARLQTRPAGEQLGVDLQFLASEGRTFTVQGTVPNRLSLLADATSPDREREAVSLAIRSEAFPLDWLSPWLQTAGVERFAGLLQADARIEGTMASPRVSGTMGLAEGVLRLPKPGIDYHGITGQLSLSGDRLMVRSWRADADGSATLEGSLLLRPLDNPRLDLTVHFDGFRAIRNEFVRLGLKGEAAVTGTLEAPHLGGNVTIQKTDVFADQVGQNPSVRPVTLTEQDYAMLESYFGFRPGSTRNASDLLMPWAIDLGVRIDGDVWLRRKVRPEVNIVLGGSLDVRKQAGDSLQLFGTVEVVPARSVVEQFGKKFAVEEGTITFNGPISGWRADFSARYEVPAYKDPGASEVAITLDVAGGADDMRLTLGAEPAMETTDIVSYLVTGRPSRAAADFGQTSGNGGLSAQSSALAIGALTDVLEDEAAQQVGLDVMEIRQDPAEGTLVIAGRYVSPKLYVGFQQPVTQGQREEGLDEQHQGTQVELEYSLYRWLLLNLQGGAEFRWFFRTRYAF